MAQLSATVTNSINFFGGQVTYKWGSTADKSLVWGQGLWGNGPDMLLTIEKGLPNSVVVSNTISSRDITKVYGDSVVVSGIVIKEPEKFLANSFSVTNVVYKEPEKVIDGSVSLTDAYVRDVDKVISNSIAVSGDMYSEEKYQGVWAYVVEGESSNFEDRPTNTWTAGSDAGTAFTSGAAATTTWTPA